MHSPEIAKEQNNSKIYLCNHSLNLKKPNLVSGRLIFRQVRLVQRAPLVSKTLSGRNCSQCIESSKQNLIKINNWHLAKGRCRFVLGAVAPGSSIGRIRDNLRSHSCRYNIADWNYVRCPDCCHVLFRPYHGGSSRRD